MPDNRPDERFIAGAVCPSCQALDRIVVATREMGVEHQRCVSCGFEKIGGPVASTPPSSRLQRHETPPSATVRIVHPQDPRK